MTDQISDLGSGLRTARERSGVTLNQIADTTKVSLRYLRALESNRIDQLPGGIYRRAIVRTYAAHVGLDPEQTLRRFLSQYPDDVPTWSDLLAAQRGSAARTVLQSVFGVLGALLSAR